MDEELLAFDYGKTIGVARGNSVARIAEPLEPVKGLEEIKALITRLGPKKLIVGLPRGLEGQETDQTTLVRGFISELQQFNLPVIAQDEALTSVEAQNQDTQKFSEHSLAAAIILNDYMRENY